MAYTTADARQQLLDSLATAVTELGSALGALGEGYEQLDEQSAERLESELFRPVQTAYARAQRTYLEFAGRHELPSRTFSPASRGAPSTGAKGFIDSAVESVGAADSALATLQDSMLPVEVGDAELRSDLREIRERLSGLGGRARELVRTLGR
jgi:hypothetical protein